MIQDTISHHGVRALTDAMRKLGTTTFNRLSDMVLDVIDYHSDTQESIEMAMEARVKTLVMTHMVPPPRNWILKRIGLLKLRRPNMYKGMVVVGKDHMEFTLPPQSDKIIMPSSSWWWPTASDV